MDANSYYYCTDNNACVSTLPAAPVPSCEKGIITCLSYKSRDLGVFQIVPYVTTSHSFNYNLTDGNSIKFAVSNQDPNITAWMAV